MPTITKRLDAIEAAIGDARSRDRDERGREFYKLIDDKKLVVADFERLLPENLALVREDIVREAMWLRRSIDTGETPTIRDRLGQLAAVIAIPPGIAVPEMIMEPTKAARDYISTSVWERDDPMSDLGWWVEEVAWLTALGPDDGDELRRRLHNGYFAHLTADDPRNIERYDRTDGWHERPDFTDALTAAITGRPAAPTRRTVSSKIDNPMQYIV